MSLSTSPCNCSVRGVSSCRPVATSTQLAYLSSAARRASFSSAGGRTCRRTRLFQYCSAFSRSSCGDIASRPPEEWNSSTAATSLLSGTKMAALRSLMKSPVREREQEVR